MTYTAWRETWPKVVVDCDTATALDAVEKYYATWEGRPRYTGARFEVVAAMNPDPNSIGPADFVAVSMLSVKVLAKAAVRLLEPETASHIKALLQQIPHASIVDADSEVLARGAPADELWRLLRSERDGIGPTTASKLIAAKRPQLIPIWDSVVERTTGLDTNDYWRRFQTVLLADERRIWCWLVDVRQQAAGVPASVTNLRILDVILWMIGSAN